MSRGIFISGTDTGVGKTLFSATLMTALGDSAIYWKPVQSGDDDDTETVRTLAPKARTEEPEYRLALPASPDRAAAAEGREILVDRLKLRYARMNGPVVAEGAGGLLTPIHPASANRELALALGLSMILVVSPKLGCINHTLLSIEAARNVGLTVLGLVISGDEDPGLDEYLIQRLEPLMVSRVSKLKSVDSAEIRLRSQQFARTPLSERIKDELG